MDFSLEQLKEIIAALNQTDITELNLESGDLRLNIRKEKTVVLSSPPALLPVSPAPAASLPEVPMLAGVTPMPSPVPAETTPAKNLVEITSPMVGTFYRASAPDEAPFIEKGDQVKKGQAVCIIEAMKLMNEIEAEVSGRIVDILVQNAQPIEYGQVLMRVEIA